MLLGISYAGAATSCTDISANLFRFQESVNVLAFQNFLFDKGFLKAKPNGYFGNQTFAAVKLYQQSKGLSAVGNVGPLTRATIKKESCLNGSATSSASTLIKGNPIATVLIPATNQSSSQTSAVSNPYPNTPSGIRNGKRREDITMLLKAMYARYVDSHGVHSMPVGDTPIELCAYLKPLKVEIASSTVGDIVITKDSPCLKFVDISYLFPLFLANVPRDPSIISSEDLLGYTITRSEYNDITIQAKSAEDGAIIKVTCNFNGYCKDIKYISTLVYKKPTMTSMSRTTVLRDAVTATPFVITGSEFTQKNTVKLYSELNRSEKTLGEFSSTEISSTTDKITLENDVFNQVYPCIYGGCSEKLPLGDYMLSVTNEGGASNALRITLKSFTTSTIATHDSTSITPTSKNVKVATLTLSSSYLLALKSLTLTSTSTAKNLPAKLTNFVLKDALTGTTYAGGSGVFGFSGVNLYSNESKIYDLYIDVSDMEFTDAGFITYGGKIGVTDDVTGAQMEIPIKPFSFTVSY